MPRSFHMSSHISFAQAQSQASGETTSVTEQLEAQQMVHRVDTALSISVIVIPFVFITTVLIHKRRKAAILRQRVEMLERSWRLDFREKTF
jgi:BMFP domain-containing protein YqiC